MKSRRMPICLICSLTILAPSCMIAKANTPKSFEEVEYNEINSELIWFELKDTSGGVVGFEVGPGWKYSIDGFPKTDNPFSLDVFNGIVEMVLGSNGFGQCLGYDLPSVHIGGRTLSTKIYEKAVVFFELRRREDGSIGIESFQAFLFREIEGEFESCGVLGSTDPEGIAAWLNVGGRCYLALAEPAGCEGIAEASLVLVAGPLDEGCPGPQAIASPAEQPNNTP